MNHIAFSPFHLRASDRVHTSHLLGRAVAAIALVLLMTAAAHAGASGGSGMPWDSGLTHAMEAISGPTAKAIAVICICLLGLGMAFSEGGSILRKALWAGVGLTIALTAGSTGMSVLGVGAGALF